MRVGGLYLMLGICDHSSGMEPLIWTNEDVVKLPSLSSSTISCSLSTKLATEPCMHIGHVSWSALGSTQKDHERS